MRPLLFALGLGLLSALAACSQSRAVEPSIVVANCGGEVQLVDAPRRVVAMNQSAAENLIALDLQERIVATGWLDSDPAPEFREAYAAIPVHWRAYPSPQQFAAVEPDFAYATFLSAFDDDVVRARANLRPFGIEVYVSPWACEAVDPAAPLSFALIERELLDLANVFGVADRGLAVVDEMRRRVDGVRALGARRPGEPLKIVWYVSGVEQPLVGAGQGVLQLLTETVGATNAFDGAPGSYAATTWERIAEADPDWIGVIDQRQVSADSKLALLTGRPETRDLRAVAEGRFVTLKFADTLPSVRAVSAAEELLDALP